MASLSTVYAISVFLSSVAGMGSAFLANQIYPLVGGSEPSPSAATDVAKTVKKADQADIDARKKAEAPPPPPAEDLSVKLKELLEKHLPDKNVVDAYNIIVTPVSDWSKVLGDKSVRRRIVLDYHPDKCVGKEDICTLIFKKFGAMQACEKGEPCEQYGDETAKAIEILEKM